MVEHQIPDSPLAAASTGPPARQDAAWELPMQHWKARVQGEARAYLESLAGGVPRAVICCPKPKQKALFIRPCDPGVPKAIPVTLEAEGDALTFSLYTALLAFSLPPLPNAGQARFPCWPSVEQATPALLIDVGRCQASLPDRTSRGGLSTLGRPISQVLV